MSDDGFVPGIVLGSFLAIALGAIILMASGVPNSYTNGYCAGMGGTTITYKVCNVDGKVVEVK